MSTNQSRKAQNRSYAKVQNQSRSGPKGQTRTFEIIGGPSIERLFDSLRYAYDPDGQIYVDFVVVKERLPIEDPDGGPPLNGIRPLKMSHVRIVALEHEDGSGCSFNLKGYARGVNGMFTSMISPFTAYYNSKTRKGTITFRHFTERNEDPGNYPSADEESGD